MFNINKYFADDWIQTAHLWYRKQTLCQLSHTATALTYKKLSINLKSNFKGTDINNYLGNEFSQNEQKLDRPFVAFATWGKDIITRSQIFVKISKIIDTFWSIFSRRVVSSS